jgi:hypothetical protein
MPRRPGKSDTALPIIADNLIGIKNALWPGGEPDLGVIGLGTPRAHRRHWAWIQAQCRSNPVP